MFLKKNKINNTFGMMNTIIKTKKFYCFQNNYKSKNYFQIFDKNLNEYENIKLSDNVLLDQVFHNNNILLARNGNTSKPLIIDINNFSITYLSDFPYFLGFNIEINGLIAPIFDSIDIYSVPKSGLFDFENNKLLWLTYDANNLFFYNKILFGEFNNIINRYNNQTGEILWQFNITDIQPGGNISCLIGVYQNILIAGIGTDWLLGIDTQSGKLVWKRELTPNFITIDKNKGVLYSLISIYIKLNPLTGKTLDLFDNKNYFEKEIGIESQRDNYAIAGNYLITTDWRKGKIGAFNTLTHRFDWIHEEPGISFPGGHPIKYSEPYLFVMDNKHNLHIFEKQ